jgi:hypothetical protein
MTKSQTPLKNERISTKNQRKRVLVFGRGGREVEMVAFGGR